MILRIGLKVRVGLFFKKNPKEFLNYLNCV